MRAVNHSSGGCPMNSVPPLPELVARARRLTAGRRGPSA
jgi:hypothetical protein